MDFINDLIEKVVATPITVIAIDSLGIIMLLLLAIEIVNGTYNIKSRTLVDRFSTMLNSEREVKYSHYAHKNKGVTIEMSVLDNFQLNFIERTNIKRYLPFINVYWIFLVMAIILIFATISIIPLVGNIITAVILAAVASSIPLMILDIMGNQMSERSRRDLHSFVKTLRTWSHVRSDILYIFEKASMDQKGPLGEYAKQMVVQIKSGLPADVAMEIMRLKVNNEYFDTFILNISQAFINQGDLVALLMKLEKESHRLEKAYNDRKIKTLMDRILIFGLMIGTLVIAISLLSNNETVRRMFVMNGGGQMVLAISSLIFALGVYMQFRITKFEH